MFTQFYRIASNDNTASDLPVAITIDQFQKGTNHFVALITDADQLSFFIQGYSSDGHHITSSELMNLLEAAYQMAHLHHPIMDHATAESLVNAAMHNKESSGVSYISKWCLQHCPRLVYWMHRHMANALSSSSAPNRDSILPQQAIASVVVKESSPPPLQVLLSPSAAGGEDDKQQGDEGGCSQEDQVKMKVSRSKSNFGIVNDTLLSLDGAIKATRSMSCITSLDNALGQIGEEEEEERVSCICAQLGLVEETNILSHWECEESILRVLLTVKSAFD